MRRETLLTLLSVALAASHPTPSRARDLSADPTSYTAMVSALVAGDTLHLAGGTYALLHVTNLNGTAAMPIVITGPDTGTPATFVADSGPCCNTIELTNSSYVTLRNLVVDAQHVDGAFGVSASGGDGNLVHHITVEGCTFLNHDGGQQTDAISTKTTTWGWVIRGNRILGAGTGLYLGNSTGTDAFIGGTIENNLVENPIGYCMEIKWQLPRSSRPGMPTTPTTTIIRNNVFIKNDQPSPSGDRPNVLVGGFPATGPGSSDRYEIYGNVFVHNPRESLLQVSGRVTIHDNLFVDVAGTAIVAQDHDLPLRQAFVYDNTIYSAGTGISFGSAAPDGDAVVGNLVFAATPIRGPITTMHDNVTDTVANASMYVVMASTTPGTLDLYPLVGHASGAAIDLTPFAADTDHDRDFNCTPKGTATFRGAYAGEGTNPGWHVIADLKPDGCSGAMPMIDAGVPPSDAGIPTLDGGSSEGGALDSGVRRDGSTGGPPAASGCGCRVATGNLRRPILFLFGFGWVAASRVARRQRRDC